MKTIVEKIRGTFAKKQAGNSAVINHPNFWMYS